MSLFLELDNLYLGENHRRLRRRVRRFVDSEVVPYAEDWDQQGRISPEIWQKMGALGLLGVSFSEASDGSNLGALGTLVLAEELGRATFGGFTMSVTAQTDLSASHIDRHGSDFLKKKYMPSIVAGERVCAVAITEPDAGSDVAGLKTRARRDGDDYVLNGTKLFISNGVHADLYILAARTDPDAKGSRGVSLFVIERNMVGFSTSKPLNKTGCKSSDTAQLFLDNVSVPVENLIGEENKGFYYIMSGFQQERISVAGNTIGMCEAAIEITLSCLKERRAFGEASWNTQSIKLLMAKLLTELTAAKQLVYHTAYLDSQGQDASAGALMVKALIPELANKILNECTQLHGPIAFMSESVIERILRDVRIAAIAGGATEVMLLELAKKLAR